MAVEVINAVWEHSQAREGARLVLLALADRARKTDGVCWPSIADIARRVKLSERNVQKHIAKLIALGELCRAKLGGGNIGDTNTYQITLPGVGSATCRGGVYVMRGGDTGTRPVAGAPPKPSVNHHNNRWSVPDENSRVGRMRLVTKAEYEAYIALHPPDNPEPAEGGF